LGVESRGIFGGRFSLTPSIFSGGVFAAPGLEEVEISGVFSKLPEAEDKLSGKAQDSLEKLPVGHAAELMEKVINKGESIKNPDKYVTAAVNRWEKTTAAYTEGCRNDDEDDEDEVVRAPEVEVVEVPDPSPEGEEAEGWGWQHDAGEEDGRGWQDESVWEEEAAGWGDDYWWLVGGIDM